MKNITVYLHEVPVQVEVSKYTTCDDVIEMVLYSTKDKADSHKYGLFESAHGVDKLTTGKSLITKITRSYGAGVDNLSLKVRKVDDFKGKLPTLSKAKRKLAKLLNAKSKKTTSTDAADKTIMNNLAGQGICTKEGVYQKDLNLTNKYDVTEDSKLGKIALMRRYLDDITNRAPDNIPYSMDCTCDGNDTIEESVDLDTAFVEQYEDMTDLNECVIYDDDNESAFHESLSEDSEGPGSIGEGYYEHKEKNIDNLINMFDTVVDRNKSHDKVLESFMKTLVHCNSTDDEGLSSMESDDAYSF